MKTVETIGYMSIYTSCNQDFHTITVTPDILEVNALDTLKEVFGYIVDYCNRFKIGISHERIFGSGELYETIAGIRRDIYEQGGLSLSSFTYVVSETLHKSGFAGIHLYGVSTANKALQKVYHNNKEIGCKWSNKDLELITLHSIHDESVTKTPYEQTVNYFRKVHEILTSQGFTLHDVCRTWIYLDNILEQYDDFNKGRTKVFKELEILKTSETKKEQLASFLPASTGIEGGNIYNASGIMDVFAIKVKSQDLKVYNEEGKLQKSAYDYGSAFSRSVVIEDSRLGHRHLFLSGTASIDEGGVSVHMDDIDQQIEMTFGVIHELLAEHGTNMTDLCEGTVFIKSPAYIHNFKAYCLKHNFPPMPLVFVVSVVCRDELLFEMDARFLSNMKR